MARIPKRLNADKYMLYTLNKVSPKLRKLILQHCDRDLIKTFSEISLNTMQGNINLSRKDKTSLKKYKNKLRKLGCSKTPSIQRENYWCSLVDFYRLYYRWSLVQFYRHFCLNNG